MSTRLVSRDLLHPKEIYRPPLKPVLDEMYKFAGVKPNMEIPIRALVKGKGNFRITDMEPGKHWEYPYAVIKGEFRRGLRVIDCGAGKGLLQFYLAHLGCDVVSLDQTTFHSKKLLRVYKFLNRLGIPIKSDPSYFIRRSARKLGVEVDFVNNSIIGMPFDDESFDRVLCISVLEHIPRDIRKRALENLVRILGKGGRLVLTVDYHPDGAGGAITHEELKLLLEECGVSGYEDPPATGKKYWEEIREYFGEGMVYTSLGLVVEKDG